MSDLITPAILTIFGTVMVLVVMGFFLARQRESRSRFETQDYYKTYKRSGDRYSPAGNPFRQNPVAVDRNEQRLIAGIVIGLVVVAVIVSLLFDVFEGLLLIFLLPVIVRFVRTRRETNSRRNTTHDGNHPSY